MKKMLYAKSYLKGIAQSAIKIGVPVVAFSGVFYLSYAALSNDFVATHATLKRSDLGLQMSAEDYQIFLVGVENILSENLTKATQLQYTSVAVAALDKNLAPNGGATDSIKETLSTSIDQSFAIPSFWGQKSIHDTVKDDLRAALDKNLAVQIQAWRDEWARRFCQIECNIPYPPQSFLEDATAQSAEELTTGAFNKMATNDYKHPFTESMLNLIGKKFDLSPIWSGLEKLGLSFLHEDIKQILIDQAREVWETIIKAMAEAVIPYIGGYLAWLTEIMEQAKLLYEQTQQWKKEAEHEIEQVKIDMEASRAHKWDIFDGTIYENGKGGSPRVVTGSPERGSSDGVTIYSKGEASKTQSKTELLLGEMSKNFNLVEYNKALLNELKDSPMLLVPFDVKAGNVSSDQTKVDLELQARLYSGVKPTVIPTNGDSTASTETSVKQAQIQANTLLAYSSLLAPLSAEQEIEQIQLALTNFSRSNINELSFSQAKSCTNYVSGLQAKIQQLRFQARLRSERLESTKAIWDSQNLLSQILARNKKGVPISLAKPEGE